MVALQAREARDKVYAALRGGGGRHGRGRADGDLVSAVDAVGGKTCPDQALRLDGAWFRVMWKGGVFQPVHDGGVLCGCELAASGGAIGDDAPPVHAGHAPAAARVDCHGFQVGYPRGRQDRRLGGRTPLQVHEGAQGDEPEAQVAPPAAGAAAAGAPGY